MLFKGVETGFCTICPEANSKRRKTTKDQASEFATEQKANHFHAKEVNSKGTSSSSAEEKEKYEDVCV